MNPYVLTGTAWVVLGIGTGIVAGSPLGRFLFIGISWLLFEAGWDFFGALQEKHLPQ
jgi:hypothetical protein